MTLLAKKFGNTTSLEIALLIPLVLKQKVIRIGAVRMRSDRPEAQRMWSVARSWGIAAAAAFLGWLLALLLGTIGVRPGGLVLGIAGVGALTVSTLYALVRKLRVAEVLAYTFASIVLEWPILFVATTLILVWTGVYHFE
jgi:hypothetical protein